MKSFTLLFIIFLSFFFKGYSQLDTIPNAGFERWQFGGWFENPEGWQTNNNQMMEFVVKDSDEYSGALAMKVKANGWAKNIFPFKSKWGPLLVELTCYAKYKIQPSDSIIIKMNLISNGKIIDSGSITLTDSSDSYKSILFELKHWKYNPRKDSLEIIVQGGTKSGGYIIVDDMKLLYFVSIKENEHTKPFWKVSALDNQSVKFEPLMSLSKKSIIQIVTVNGCVIYDQTTSAKPFIVPLYPGIYFYRIISDNRPIQSGKVVIP